MKVVIGGKSYRHFTSGSVTSKLTSITREFELEAGTKGVNDIPFRKGQTVQMSAGDDKLFNGYIDRIEIKGKPDDLTYSLSGRDLLSDVVDSNLDGLPDTGLTVEHACKVVIGFLEISVKVIDLADTRSRPFESSLDIVAPEPADTAGQFLKSVAQRRQVLLTSDGDANLIITEGIGQAVDGKLINRVDGKGNNLQTFEFATDDSRRFGFYTSDSQFNVAAIGSAGGAAPSPREIVDSHSIFRDKAIRSSRRRSVPSESSYPIEDSQRRVRWEANMSRAEGITYDASIDGHRDRSGALWIVNTAPLVEDGFAGINARMLIKGIRYRFDQENETTELQLTDREAYRSALLATKGLDFDD